MRWFGQSSAPELSLGFEAPQSSPLSWHLASTHPALHWFTLTLNTCSWWLKVDCSFPDIFCLTWHQICRLHCQFWCQFSGRLSHWLTHFPQSSHLLVLFLCLIRKPEVFSIAIVVNCDQGANDDILGGSKVCEALITYCADIEHGSPWIIHTALHSC